MSAKDEDGFTLPDAGELRKISEAVAHKNKTAEESRSRRDGALFEQKRKELAPQATRWIFEQIKLAVLHATQKGEKVVSFTMDSSIRSLTEFGLKDDFSSNLWVFTYCGRALSKYGEYVVSALKNKGFSVVFEPYSYSSTGWEDKQSYLTIHW